jgi:hypothetical protein
MAKPELNKTYICLHSYTHPNLGRLLTKGNKYTCTSINTDNDIIAMKGTRRGGINCCQKFFEETFAEPEQTEQLQTKKLTLTVAEAVWLKNFFAEHIDEIADIDGGTDYEALLTVEEKIKKL